jgi:hypothetical protein
MRDRGRPNPAKAEVLPACSIHCKKTRLLVLKTGEIKHLFFAKDPPCQGHRGSGEVSHGPTSARLSGRRIVYARSPAQLLWPINCLPGHRDRPPRRGVGRCVRRAGRRWRIARCTSSGSCPSPRQHATKASKRPKRCSLRLASSASQGEGHTARTSTTEDASTHPVEERLRTGSLRARDKVAVSGTLTERMGSNEPS